MSRREERSASPQGRRGGNSRSPSPLARQLFGDDMTAEDMAQYNELLEQFGGDEEQLAEAIQQFMQEYENNPEQFENEMNQQQQQRGGSRSPSAGRR